MTIAQDTCNQTSRHPAQTILIQFAGLAGKAIGYVKNRAERAAFRKLLTLDDRMLKDVGVTRGDVHWASELPLGENAGQALRRESLKARKKSW